MQKNYKKYFLLFVLPTFVAFVIAFIAPFLMGLGLSFCEFQTVVDAEFVGFDNYIKAFQNKDFVTNLLYTVCEGRHTTTHGRRSRRGASC